MLTWVIVKARIDSSLNLYEYCVACDNENNCPAGPALWGQPCGAAYPANHAFDLRCTPLVEVLKHLEKRCTAGLGIVAELYRCDPGGYRISGF